MGMQAKSSWPTSCPVLTAIRNSIPSAESRPGYYQLSFDFEEEIRALEGEFSRLTGRRAGETQRERALVLCSPRAKQPGGNHRTRQSCRSRNRRSPGLCRREKFTPVLSLARDACSGLALAAMRRSADVAIFDIDLKPAQARAFEDTTG